MSVNTRVLLSFQRPKPGGYIGGLVTLCNDYINKSEAFVENQIELSCFNYEIPSNIFFDKIRNSKLRNLLYGYLQGSALIKYLKSNPDYSIHIHTSRKALFFKDVLLAKRIRKQCKGKILMTIHVGDISTVFHNKITQRYLLRLMNKSVDTVLFLSDKMRQQFIDSGLEESRTAVLYNCYNIKRLKPEDKLRSSVPQLLFLGSINREKGIIELLTAAKSISSEFHLNVCGSIIEESIREEFENLLSQLGPRVTYHGYIGKDRKEELLKSTDILILPSYREGLPISILEAMATSCAIITTPVGAIPEILTEKNAIIVEPRNSSQLETAISFLLNHKEEIQNMKKANFSDSDKYTDKSHILRLCQLYKR